MAEKWPDIEQAKDMTDARLCRHLVAWAAWCEDQADALERLGMTVLEAQRRLAGEDHA